MRRLNTFVLFILGCMVILCNSSVAATKQVIAGAGPSTKIVQLFTDSFSKLPAAKEIEFEVPPKSSKHKGGIVSSNYNFFGRTGRPLNAKEKELNKEEIILARVPIAIVVGKATGITQLTLSQLESIIRGNIINWKEVGGEDNRIIIVGRETSEALFSVLKQDYTFFEQANFEVSFNKDNHVVDYFKKNPESKYAIGFGAMPNFVGVDEINILTIEGFESGVSLGLVYDIKNRFHPVVIAADKHAKSQVWKDIVIQNGLLPPN